MQDLKQPASPVPLDAQKGKRRHNWIVLCLAVVILVPAGIGFTTKLVEFYRTSRGDEHGGFAILPLVLYLTVSAGFLCLLLWAAFQGMFHDVERPKFTMLETEDRLEHAVTK